jgi:protein TonB
MAREEFITPFKVDYGAVELKRVSQKMTTVGLIVATVIHLSAMGAYWGAVKLSEEDEPTHMVRIMKYSDIGPPPSLQNAQAAPAVAVSAPAVKPNVGIPVPVPDAEVSPEQTIATQAELSQQAAPVSEGAGTGAGTQIQQDIKIDDEGPPPDFVPYEKEPQIVRKVEPKYPEIALRAGLEGNVFIKIWVDKEGKPRKAVVIKSDAQIFEQVAIDAAMQYIFTPAVMQKGPVSVWVSIPFKFRLSNK